MFLGLLRRRKYNPRDVPHAYNMLKKIVTWRFPFTDFYGLDTVTMMLGSSNPYLKRYVEDYQWIQSWRGNSRKYIGTSRDIIVWRSRRLGRQLLFVLWELTSHCGRSFILWMFWSLMIACFFGFLYAQYSFPSWLSWVPGLEALLTNIPHPILDVSPGPPDRIPTSFTPYYFSIVTFTTLGFGDVKPLNLAGEVWLAIEVLFGYVMLGGLISIFSNKLARRS